MSLDFSPYRAVLLDLDGTICHDNQILPGARELLVKLKAEKRAFACISNSTDSPLRVMTRLDDMRIEIDPTNIYTAAAAACDYVIETFGGDESGGKKPRVFNLATESVDEMLDGLVEWVNDAKDVAGCDAIVVGPPTSKFSTEDRRRSALQLARQGATIVGTCADRVFVSARGVEFGAGAATWMLAYAAAADPVFCGKPDPLFFHELCRRMNVDPTYCILIGDNLEADIAGAKAVGMRTVLTLSGVSREEDVARIPAERRPDLIVRDLSGLI